ncbi:FkbM family methyltransferase [Nocardioides sp. HDW12B]|uniref:FkbM family methyltransferase n=1 Tax=Nocardioides sp. HDW12B TaxID=2714939 RepID=UPI00140B3368|nr:FkbM family methyltransferase [Nocardioides sp. HDW12B]QIK67303.1 FkbM family methyltransferase [Nocardioides sp. HDW12B]
MSRPASRLRRALSSVRSRLGQGSGDAVGGPTRSTPLGSRARLVQHGEGRRLVTKQLGTRSWLVHPRRGPHRRTVTTFGPADHQTFLLTPEGKPDHHVPLLKHVGHEHVGQVLHRLGVTCVLDVGANRGQYGQRLRETGYTGRIVSFEPLDHLADQVADVAADAPDWTLMRCALGREDSKAEIHVDTGKGTLSSMLEPSDFGRSWNQRLREEPTMQTVQVRRLDDVWDEVVEGLEDPRVFLKLDTQGFDLEAFAGAGERVADVLAMQSELASMPIYDGMPRMTEQLETYQDAGFVLSGLFPVGVHKPTMGVIEFDAVMVRPEAVRAAKRAGRRGGR